MGMVGLIFGTLAAGSGLLVLMTWLEAGLEKSLAPAEAERRDRGLARADLDAHDPRARVAA